MKETNPDEGEYPTATESCAADKQMNHQDHLFFLQLFVAQLSNCRQTFLYFQLLQHIPMSKSAPQIIQVACLYILANLSPCVGRSIC